jgi:hypothetical protein
MTTSASPKSRENVAYDAICLRFGRAANAVRGLADRKGHPEVKKGANRFLSEKVPLWE